MVTISFLTLLNEIGGMGVFFLFGALTLVALAYFAVKVPETKGRSLQQLEGPHGQGGRLAGKVHTTRLGGSGAVKKLFILALLVLGGFAVYRRIQAQRADLDLWSEATTADDY